MAYKFNESIPLTPERVKVGMVVKPHPRNNHTRSGRTMLGVVASVNGNVMRIYDVVGNRTDGGHYFGSGGNDSYQRKIADYFGPVSKPTVLITGE